MIGHLSLPGYSSGIGVDDNLHVAAVATGSALQVVDVSNGMSPLLLHSVAVPATQVVVSDGLAYAASGNTLSVVDLESGSVIQSLSLPMYTVTGLARDGSFLYVYGGDVFAVIDISNEQSPRLRGTLSVSIATSDVGVFAANGIAWLAGSGLHTIDVSNPDEPTLIHGADVTFTARRIALNGSGLGLLAPAGNSYVEVYDTSNPDVTADRLLQIPLSAGASDVAISNGIAYVGEDGQLQVVNYLQFDNKGVPPTATITTSAPDVDLLTPGLQVLEGSTLPIQVNASDDVQVAKVELLVNGNVVQTAVSYPFNFFALAPTVAQSGNSFTVQVEAFDTGGNVGFSNVLTVGLENDTSPPTITTFSPAQDSSGVESPQTIQVTFSKAMNPAAATASNFYLVDGNGNVVPGGAIQVRDNDLIVQLTFPFLPAGNYQLVINGPGVTDRAGVALSTGTVTDSFTLTPRETLTVTNPDADTTTPGLQLYEGVTVQGSVTVATGVSVQEVDVLLNGQVIATSSSAPLSYSFIAPLLSAGASSFTLQARVIDTSGITTLSAPLTVGLLVDLTPPTIVSTTPANGGTAGQGLQTLTITFSKSLSTASSAASNFQLAEAGSNGLFGSGNELLIPITNIQLENDSTEVVLTTAGLAVGTYQLRLNQAAITDRVGNPLGTGTYTDQFTVTVLTGVILVADNSTNSVTAINATNDTVRGSVSITPNGGVIGAVAVTADGTMGFVTNFDSEVWVINLSGTVPQLASGTNPIPISNLGEDIALTPDQKYLIVTDGGGSTLVSVVSVATRTQVSTFNTGSESTSVDVLSDGSVLVGSTAGGTVRRLTLNAAGQLVDTGESLSDNEGPPSVYGRPGRAQAGVAVDYYGSDLRSFTIGTTLQQVSVRSLSGGSGISAVISPSGNEVYARSSTNVEAFTFNSTTGVVGSTPLFTLSTSTVGTAYYGINEIAISADGTLLYVPQGTQLSVFSAATGSLVTTISNFEALTGVAVSGGLPQFFAGTPKPAGLATPDLTQAQLQPVITTAIADLAAAGYQVKTLSHVVFQLTPLPDSLLGWTYQNTISIDPDAQGYGWYTDASPSSTAAFTQVTGKHEFQAVPGSPAYGHVDLLTVVTHELGHILGYASIDPSVLGNDWMTATLATGVRARPRPAHPNDPARPHARFARGNEHSWQLGRNNLGRSSAATSQAAAVDPFTLAVRALQSPALMMNNLAGFDKLANTLAFERVWLESSTVPGYWESTAKVLPLASAEPGKLLPAWRVESAGVDVLVGKRGDDSLLVGQRPDDLFSGIVTTVDFADEPGQSSAPSRESLLGGGSVARRPIRGKLTRRGGVKASGVPLALLRHIPRRHIPAIADNDDLVPAIQIPVPGKFVTAIVGTPAQFLPALGRQEQIRRQWTVEKAQRFVLLSDIERLDTPLTVEDQARLEPIVTGDAHLPMRLIDRQGAGQDTRCLEAVDGAGSPGRQRRREQHRADADDAQQDSAPLLAEQFVGRDRRDQRHQPEHSALVQARQRMPPGQRQWHQPAGHGQTARQAQPDQSETGQARQQQPTRRLPQAAPPAVQGPGQQHRGGRVQRQDVVRQFGLRQRKEDHVDADPTGQQPQGRPFVRHVDRLLGQTTAPRPQVPDRRPQKDRPGQQADEQNPGVVQQRRAAVVFHGGGEATLVVLLPETEHPLPLGLDRHPHVPGRRRRQERQHSDQQARVEQALQTALPEQQ